MNRRDQHTGFRLIAVTPEMLGEVDALSGLTEPEMISVGARCDGLLCPPDQCLLGRSDPSGSVYFILEGSVKVTSFSKSEREVVFREMPKGQIVGELAAISGKPRSAEVWTTVETKVARISANDFWQLMHDYPVAMKAIVRHLVDLLHSLSERVFEHDSLKLDSRIHAELLRMAVENGVEGNASHIVPAPTREDLGKLVGTTRFMVSGELRKLERAGVVDLGRRRIVVTDVAQLRDLVERGKERGRYAPAAGDRRPRQAGAPERPAAAIGSVEAALVAGWNRAVRATIERTEG